MRENGRVQLLDSALGHWRNTAIKSRGFSGFTIIKNADCCMIRLEGVSTSFDWGEHVIHTFDYQGADASFYTRFRLNDRNVDLIANTNKGLFVLAAYLEFDNEPGRNYLIREFFVPSA